MRNLSLLSFALALFFSACTQEEVVDNPVTVNQPTEAAFDSDAFQKALVVDGQAFYAGYGYSPALDRAYRPAVDPGEAFQEAGFGGTSIEVDIIDNDKDLFDFIDDQDSVGVDIPYFKPLSFSISVKERLVKSLKITDTTITVVARIKNQQAKHQTSDELFITEQAASLLENAQVDRFLRRYGPTFVRTHVVGGEIYYAYSLDASNLTKYEKEELARSVKIGVEGIFGFGSSKELTTIEKETINSRMLNLEIVCSVPGFVPEVVTLDPDQTEDKIGAEAERLNQYLLDNPTLASTIEMEVLPYANLWEIELYELQEAYASEMKCYGDWEKWVEVREAVLYVYNNTTSLDKKAAAQGALSEIDLQITNARSCNGSVTPAVDAYAHITQ